MGTVAAVDGEDGTLLWIGEYPQLAARGKREAIRVENRWQPNPVLAIGDQLIIAPQDSTYLIALSRMTGEVSWRTPREQGSTLVGADDHACFIAGAELVAIAHSGERRGQTLWRFGAEPPGAPAGREGNGLLPLGRAFFSLDALLVPTRTAFYRLSPADGRVLSRTFWDFAGGGGNLLLTGRLLAVTNPEGFLIYSDLEKERDRIEALPGDATETFLERAKFHLKQGEVPEGLAALKAWERNAPPPPAPNSFLDHLQLDLAEIVSELTRLEETKPHLEALLRYRVRLERAPPRKVAATIALAEHLERAGDRAGALKAFHDGLAFDSPATEYAPDGLPVPSATYIRDRIVRLRRSSPLESGTAFAALDREAREALSQARKKGTPPSYFEVIRLYPYTPAAADALLDLSVFFHDLQSYDRAIRVLEDYLRDYPTGKDALRAKVFMANLLNQSGRRREARERYAILLKEHPDARVEGIPGLVRSETVRAYVEPILRDPLIDAFSPEDPPEFRFPIHMSWRSPADLESASRAFLTPLGETPEELRDCFLTQSLEAIECRRLEDGLPVWKLYFEMVPGYQLEDSQIGRFARPGLRPILGRFVRAPAPAQAANQGHLLLLQDDRNLLAIDPVKGVVRWHVPFGSRDEKPANLRQLRERVRGVGFADDGAYVATTQRELRHVNLEGATLWRAPIDYDPAPHSLAVGGNAIFVIAVKPPGVRIHERGSGRELASLGAPEGFGEKLAVPPVEVSRNRLLLALGGETKGLSGELKLLDLDEQKVLWSVRKGPVIDHLSYSPEFPEECLVVWSRENHLPLIAGISLRDGSELWRYEKFPARKSNFSLFRKQSNIYALHGENDRWQLLALELRRDPDGNRHVVTPLWPKEIPLGTFFTAHHRLHIAEDAILFPDADKMLLAVFDRVTGMSRNASAAAITAFLADKESSFTTAILNGRLVILTDGGDCAFAPEPSGKTAASIAPDMEMVRRFSEKPGDAANTDRLALHYFRAGKRDAAMSVLNRALLAEDILEEKVAENRYLMSYLLDGIKEEHMKDADRRPRISSRQFHAPPAIDGELNDSWDIATRLHLATPRQVGTIPVPGQGRDWEGEEDLSAFLYTGWDHEYFYFALDVMDDVLQAYDKDAENWKGDCLLIGLDPDGAQRNGSEQLMTLALTVPKRNKLEKQKGEKGEEEEEDESRKPDGLFSVKKKDDDSGAIYEVALPWQTFGPQFPAGIGPAEGFAFGLSLLLTDDDTGQGATKTLSLNPCHLLPRSQKNSWVWRFIIHEYFPRVTLER
jgi:tetratricopeptide (TPR) repeat protein/outer membrane protein assembly factor BamB